MRLPDVSHAPLGFGARVAGTREHRRRLLLQQGREGHRQAVEEQADAVFAQRPRRSLRAQAERPAVYEVRRQPRGDDEAQRHAVVGRGEVESQGTAWGCLMLGRSRAAAGYLNAREPLKYILCVVLRAFSGGN